MSKKIFIPGHKMDETSTMTFSYLLSFHSTFLSL